jgi:catechol-2,3-dioxygenase
MRYIIAVHMSGGTSHEHIAEVQWRDPGLGQEGKSSRATMVAWIDAGGDARVKDNRGEVQVKVVRATPPYLRTYADNRPTDNLLALPRY